MTQYSITRIQIFGRNPPTYEKPVTEPVATMTDRAMVEDNNGPPLKKRSNDGGIDSNITNDAMVMGEQPESITLGYIIERMVIVFPFPSNIPAL